MARRHSDAALGAASLTPHRSTLNTTGSWTTSTTSSPLCVITSIKPGQMSSRSRPSPPGCGPRSGPITPMNASTAKSADAPTPWESSPTATQSSAWSEPSSPNKTTNGPKADATSASTSSPDHDSHHNPPNRRTPHSNSAHNPTRRTQNDYTTPQDLTVHIDGRTYFIDIALADLKIAIEFDGRIKYGETIDQVHDSIEAEQRRQRDL